MRIACVLRDRVSDRASKTESVIESTPLDGKAGRLDTQRHRSLGWRPQPFGVNQTLLVLERIDNASQPARAKRRVGEIRNLQLEDRRHLDVPGGLYQGLFFWLKIKFEDSSAVCEYVNDKACNVCSWPYKSVRDTVGCGCKIDQSKYQSSDDLKRRVYLYC